MQLTSVQGETLWRFSFEKLAVPAFDGLLSTRSIAHESDGHKHYDDYPGLQTDLDVGPGD